MFKLPRRIVIFDTEVTTWEGAAARDWSGPGEHRELVQLGAALVETKDFTELAIFSTLVKPRINPILSDYFINLTGITQEMVDKYGIDFEVFLQSFYKWCRRYELYSFDKVNIPRLFDLDVLVENRDLYGIGFPFESERFHNVNEIFFKYGVVIKQSGRAPEACVEEPKNRSHEALNDVRGLIRGLQLLKKKVA